MLAIFVYSRSSNDVVLRRSVDVNKFCFYANKKCNFVTTHDMINWIY